MTDIFLSYAREDVDTARELAQLFEAQGWKVFWDIKIQPGSTWRKDIGIHLNAARCVVVLWSEASINSDFVADEAQVAAEKRILVPVLIQAVQPPLGFKQIQTADLTTWEGDSNGSAIASLINALKQFLDLAQPVSAPPERPYVTAKVEGRLSPQGQIALISVQGGTFFIGSPDHEYGRTDNEGPRHKIKIAPYFLGKYAVSNAEYRRYMEANPHINPPHYWNDPRFNKPEQPVVGVSWDDASRFARWAGGRLPTEGEWEYAARAGTTTRYSWGNDINRSRANYRDAAANGSIPVPVGEFDPNPWGFHQLHGNVYEWIEDRWWDRHATPASGSKRTSGNERVIRGGSWTNKPEYLRSAARDRFPLNEVLPTLGFRLALDVP